MPSNLVAGSGRVCYKNNPAGPFGVNECLGYGSDTVDPDPAAALPITGTQSLIRVQSFGSSATAFQLGTAAPKNNSSQTGIVGGMLAFSVQPSNTTAGTLISPAVQVEVQDASGTKVTTATNSITLAIGANPGGGALSGTTTVNAVSGVATFSDLSIDKAGVGYDLVVSAAGLTGATSTAFNIVAGAALKLAFSVQPSDTVAGASISPAVEVEIQDALDNIVTTATTTIAIAIGTNPGGGALSGTTPVNAVNGVATFSNLSINKAGVGYTLVADSGFSDVTSTAFNITVGAASKLAYTVQPTTSVAGASISPAVKVEIQDAFGNTVTAATITINGIDAGDKSGRGVATGDINNDGVDDLIIGAFGGDPGGRTDAGESYVLFGPLSAGTLELSSAADITLNGIDAFDFSGAGVGSGDVNNDGVTDLIIGALNGDPGGRINAGESYVLFGPLSAGTLELSTAADITLNGIDAGDRSGVRVATGDVNNDGVTDLIIGALNGDPGGRVNAGESYVLFGPLSAGTLELSTAADITLNGIDAGDRSGVRVATGDVNNDGVTDLIIGALNGDPGGRVNAGESYVLFGPLSAGTLELSTALNTTTIAIGTNPGGGALAGTTTVNAVSGVGSFSDLSIDKAGVGYTLVASASGLTGATSTAFNIVAGAASKLAFSVQPSNADAAATMSPAVEVEIQDALGNTVTTATDSITVAIGTNPSGGALTGTTPVNAVNGVGTFSDLSIDEAGVGYTLVASAAGLTGATSNAFNIATPPIAVPGITEWGLIGMAVAFVVLILLRMHRQSTQKRNSGP